ncbi:SMIM14 [Bugula neritina]|uniref:Small integral membrane protein 14 n=1 Tax=Bugula neritina TaxID=10212 RepID=A0A7J7J6B0_BUGNE|nr:SMIM14 [Bugula neritina]
MSYKASTAALLNINCLFYPFRNKPVSTPCVFKMSDLDPCECVWSHEHAMRRLINMLRNSQDACTDNECLTSPLGLQPDAATDGSNSTLMMIMVAWLLIAAVLFLFRPASMRQQTDAKGHQGNNDGSRGPPAPPAVNVLKNIYSNST